MSAESSDDNKINEETGQAIKEEIEDTDAPEGSVTEEVQDDTATRLQAMEKDYLYLRAEFENYKRQAIKERSQLLKYGAERLAFDLLDTIDVFTSAMNNEVTAENFKDFVKGVEMTSQSLKTALEKHGIKQVDCLGEAFDPNTQEALSSEVTDQYPEGHVTQVFKAPYKYHDKLLRAGQVIVSRAKSE